MTQKNPNHKKRKVESPNSSVIAATTTMNLDCCNEIPLLYKEDMGMDGIKVTPTHNSSCSIMMSGLERGGFQVPITAEEKKRRKERQARFLSATKDKVVEDSSSSTTSTKTCKGAKPVLSTLEKNNFKNGKKRPADDDITSQEHCRNVKALVGTNQNLDKPYLRLTTFPKAEDVRPLEVLVKSLARIKSRYIQDEDFDYANEQLKSLRQDITVQGLRNKFVLEVYETHARILLEHGDLSEFNQCQTMIRTLTSDTWLTFESSCNDEMDIADEGLDSKGFYYAEDVSETCLAQSDEAADEFAAYGLLYALVQHSNVPLELLRTLRILQQDTQDDDDDDGVVDANRKPWARRRRYHRSSSKSSSCRHALQVVKAVLHNDYRAFFRLYEMAPHLSAYLMDFLVKRVRDAAYERIVRAYRPTISVEYVREALHFPDLEETRRFLRNSGAVFVEEKGEPLFWIDCKASNKQ